MNLQQRQLGRLLPRGLIETLQLRGASRPRPRPRLRLQLQRRGLSIAALDRGKDRRERVVILGSGWAGYTLSQKLDPKKFQIVVVSPRSYFVFTPLLASTSVGTLEFRTALEPLRSRRSNVNFFQGWADSINISKKTITVEEAANHLHQSTASKDGWEKSEKDVAVGKEQGKCFNMSYDKLVIAVGCYSQTFNTPGVKEHALFLKDVGDARKIRKRILACFETAALPTTSETMKKNLLNFAVVGGGPTGIEFSAELHDLVKEEMSRSYPDLMQYVNITVYDVAPQVLPMFDKKLAAYAMAQFQRDGIKIKTEHHVESLRRGVPQDQLRTIDSKDDKSCWTIKIREEGEIGVGMVVWSTGLMMNPLISKSAGKVHKLPQSGIDLQDIDVKDAENVDWTVLKHQRTGGIVSDAHLRLMLEPQADQEKKPRAIVKDVFALGDCAVLEGTMWPATAQVASQKAGWLAKRLNNGDIESKSFAFKDMGVMAYLGNWNAIVQSGPGEITGRAAWFIWRGAYLTKSVSWRNKILIPTYWFINWLFGRDISRF
ncbi:Altered inheritance of mitochondria protein 24 [Venturia nashicola]|nr:Altered inheritance of mitochondria protein 24 [Venturia nashicola]